MKTEGQNKKHNAHEIGRDTEQRAEQEMQTLRKLNAVYAAIEGSKNKSPGITSGAVQPSSRLSPNLPAHRCQLRRRE